MKKAYCDCNIDNIIQARKFEMQGEWFKARQLWYKEGCMDDVKAIDLIMKSTQLGDEYREKIRGVFEDYEERKINTTELNQLLNKAHKEVYQNV